MNTTNTVKSILMIPVATAAGAVAIRLTEQWNQWVGGGGALLLGIVCFLGIEWLDRREKRHTVVKDPPKQGDTHE